MFYIFGCKSNENSRVIKVFHCLFADVTYSIGIMIKEQSTSYL